MGQRIFVFLVVLSGMFFEPVAAQQGIGPDGSGGRYNPAAFSWPKQKRALTGGAENYLLLTPASLIRIKSIQYAGRSVPKRNVSPAVAMPAPSFYRLNSLPVISPSYYCTQLGFFCTKELQLQKLTSLPLRFRLGSLEYVNYLEQKPNAAKPGFQ